MEKEKATRIILWALVIAGLIFLIKPFSSRSYKNTDVKRMAAQQEYALPTCVIKGNVSYKTREKIYHLPGCPNYFDTVINESYGERWFCTEKEAVVAGWRKARNCP